LVWIGFRDKELDGFKLIGPDGTPIDGIIYFRAEIGLGRKSGNIHPLGLTRKVLNPENLVDIEIKIPAYPFSQTVGASSFKKALPGLRGNNDNRLEMLDIRLIHRKVNDPQPPGAGPLAN
jgi:hypothetical protein